jgi:hypothetical protein
MKLLPTEAGARRRLLLMGTALVLMAAAWFKWGGGPEYVVPPTTGPVATSKPTVQPRPNARKTGPVLPEKLRLAEMETVPDEPQAGRNLFQFGMHPPPPAPKVIATPTPYVPPPPPPGPPPPPPIPPVPLWLTTVFDSDGTLRAYLHDKAGNTFEGIEGAVIDGRYRLLRVGTSSVVLTYLDGTGQVTKYIGG